MISNMNVKKIDLIKKAAAVLEKCLSRCAICPRRCGVNRLSGKLGYCRAGSKAKVYSFMQHHGEEPPISGLKGSGTVFFSHCNMKCVYCQNYKFSQLDKGREMSRDELASGMLDLMKKGCHNINLVSPVQYLPQIVAALETASSKGLDIPIVYNTSGYELAETLKLLNGIVDIYLPDMRYSDDAMAKKYSDADGYVSFDRSAIIEMHKQVGDLNTDKNGIATRGLIIRLLAIPNNVSGTINSLKFIRDNLSQNTHLSIMSQYYPAFKSDEYTELSTGISRDEYKNIVDEASLLGLNKGWIQEIPKEPDDSFLGTKINPL
ncbi:MAG: radical SAM protein [Candidatus Omnitrophica bacterium]|nr:radical SAM protein [Candidatus Omnitrophota bacterium]